MNKKTLSNKEAYIKASALCVRGEKCSFDIQAKLKLWGISAEEQGYILSQLINEKFIDNARFARAFCRDKYKFQSWGRTKIIFSLRNKNISQEIIEDAICGIDDEEYENNLFRILKSKYKSIKYDDKYKTKAAMYRYGTSRGFESQLVLKIIEQILGSIDECDEL